ncbi:MAG: glycoside hydrolase family 16 protein [Bacteroidetes bacterium]|nr:glycoside hydrolase family 16 protein [Bacteroidota bacterium]
MFYTEKIKFLLLFLLLLFLNSCNKNSPLEDRIWDLTFVDDFSGPILNRDVWKTNVPWGQAYNGDNQELWIDSAFRIEKGVLKIEAKRDTVIGMVYDENFHSLPKQFYITSGMIQSRDAFAQQYGYFEMKAKIPKGIGFWPAFWMMAYSGWPPEIDVFEILGREPNLLHMTNHFSDDQGAHKQNAFTYPGPDFSSDFHTYGIEWDPKEITWYLDGKRVFSSKVGIPQERMYLLATFGVGGSYSGFANSSTIFPAYFEIDYIKAYKRK